MSRMDKLNSRIRVERDDEEEQDIPEIPTSSRAIRQGNFGSTNIMEENPQRTKNGGWVAFSRDGERKYFRPDEQHLAKAFTQHVTDFKSAGKPQFRGYGAHELNPQDNHPYGSEPGEFHDDEIEPEPDIEFDPDKARSYADFSDEPGWPHESQLPRMKDIIMGGDGAKIHSNDSPTDDSSDLDPAVVGDKSNMLVQRILGDKEDEEFRPNGPTGREPPEIEEISTNLRDYLPEEIIQERNYKREYETYHSRPEQKKRRAQRNKARRKFTRDGKVKKGDQTDIHHRDGNPHNHKSGNEVPLSRSKNRAMKEIQEPEQEKRIYKLKDLLTAKILMFLKSKGITAQKEGTNGR